MWRCPQCAEGIEDQFTSCWSCGYEQGGTEEPEPMPAPPPLPPRATHECDRCRVPLEARGETSICVEGPREEWPLDVYVCPHCKRVSFFELPE